MDSTKRKRTGLRRNPTRQVRVGIPNSIVASCTVSLAVSSFDAKYTSKDVKNAPDSFTVNDCARGSLLPLLLLLLQFLLLLLGKVVLVT